MILLVMRYMLLSVEPLEHTTLQFFLPGPTIPRFQTRLTPLHNLDSKGDIDSTYVWNF